LFVRVRLIKRACHDEKQRKYVHRICKVGLLYFNCESGRPAQATQQPSRHTQSSWYTASFCRRSQSSACWRAFSARDGLLGAGRREDVLLVKEQALSEVGGLSAGLGLRGVVVVMGALLVCLWGFRRVRARLRAGR